MCEHKLDKEPLVGMIYPTRRGRCGGMNPKAHKQTKVVLESNHSGTFFQVHSFMRAEDFFLLCLTKLHLSILVKPVLFQYEI